LGLIFLQLGMWAAAEQQLSEVVAVIDTSNVPLLGAAPRNNLGTAKARLGDVEGGLALKRTSLEQVSEHRRLSGRFTLGIAEIYAFSGRREEALATATRAVDMLPAHPPVL